MIKMEENYATEFIIFLCCGDIYHTRKRSKIEPSDGHIHIISYPGGGLDKPAYRDQQSWVFLNDPKKYFATDRKPQKILSEKQNLKKYPQKHYSFCKIQA